MHLRHLTTLLVAAAAVAASVAGCGSSDNSQSAAKPSAPGANAGAAAVTIDNFKFAPAALTVSQDTITVTNHDNTAHTAAADDGKSFDTGNIDPGSSATIKVSEPGTYKYHCNIHPFMHGTLVVK